MYLLTPFEPTNEDKLDFELQQWYQSSSKVFQKLSRAEVSYGRRSCKTESSHQSPQSRPQRSDQHAGLSCLLGLCVKCKIYHVECKNVKCKIDHLECKNVKFKI